MVVANNFNRLVFFRLGHNGAGKSTLMRSIAEEKLDGFPSSQVLKTVFVEHALQGEDTSLPVVDFVCTDAKLAGRSREEIEEALKSVGFTGHLFEVAVSGLSGGWKMKLGKLRLRMGVKN